MIHGFEPLIGVSAVSMEPALDPLSPSLSAPPSLALSLSLSLSLLKINIKKEVNNLGRVADISFICLLT